MKYLNETTKYTIYGALFGLFFPIGSIVFLYQMNEISDTSDWLAVIAEAHRNSLLWVIDSAPLFLGLFARLAGVRQDRLLRFSASLELQVVEKTESLRLALGESQKANKMIVHMAEHDALTGLHNRRCFQKELDKWGQYALRYKHGAAVIFLDIDKFKSVNDTYGHHVGDQYLMAISDLLRVALRTTDIVARWGGDEFAVLLPETEKNSAIEVANKLLRLFNETKVNIAGHDLSFSVSIGIALFPDHGNDLTALIVYADAAMYQAKKQGRNTYHFYAPEMTQYALERAQFERLLHQAINSNELAVHYQIKMAMAPSTHPCGVEALARWHSAALGPVSPMQFIPIAEETGFIVELGEWVLRTACRQMAAWRASGVTIPRISVNLSVRQLERADIVEVVRSALQESGLPPDALELEITESVIMNVGDAIDVLKRLRELGVRLAVDDFGTGYSSLAYLKLLPINTLKIDRSFVIGIGDNQGDESIVQAVIEMAHSLGLTTVAEGVETELQLAFLIHAGCDEIQGYFFGKPQSSEEFLDTWRRSVLSKSC